MRWVLAGVGLVVVVVLVCAAWVAADALRARDALQRAAGDVAALQEAVSAQDLARGEQVVERLQERSGEAAALTTGPHWRVVSVLPWVGPNTEAVTALAGTVDELARDALPALMDASRAASPAALAPVDGRIDLAPVLAVENDVIQADAAVGRAVERVARLGEQDLVDPLTDAVDQLGAQLTEVRATTATAARAVQLVPPLLGAEGPRQYLVLVQNNAEPRATGGIPGAVLLLHAEDGRVTFVEQVAGNQLGGYAEPVTGLSDAELALFGTDLGRFMLDVNFTPDFPRSAQIAREIWADRRGQTVDGVLSLDPVALSLVLGATGPITAQDPLGDPLTLQPDEVVPFLLNGVYVQFEEPDQQDVVFGAVASAVFDAATSGQGDAGGVLDALAEGARQGRVMLWSAHEAEQELLTGTVLGGDLVGERDDAPVVGVYLNASSAAKMGYYLDTSVDVSDVACRPDGSQALTVTVTMRSTLDAGDVDDLPTYVTGRDEDRGIVRSNLLVYAPRGGGILETTASDGADAVFAQQHEGLVVAGRSVSLPPGEERSYTYVMISGKDQRAPVQVRTTPGPRPAAVTVPASQCG